MSTLHEFLHSRRVKTTQWNLTGMGSDVGKYFVNETDYSTFLTLFHNDVHIHRNPSSLLERHASYTPLLIDLDFRYSTDLKERAFDTPHIQQFLQEYASAFFSFFAYEKPLRFFVMLRPELVEEKGVVKDGIHIVCGDLSLEYETVKTLRAYTLDKGILNSFADRTNTDSDCFDESVIQQNNWFLYGASKPGKQPYIVDYCYLVHPDSSIEESDWDETDLDFLRLFSLQLNRSDPSELSLHKEKEEEWQLWKSIACEGAGVIVPLSPPNPNDAIQDTHDTHDTRSVASHLSNHISNILKVHGLEWKIDECDDGYKLSHNAKECLVATGTEHNILGHSCVFVQRSHTTLTCFSHNSKQLPKSKGLALWKLLTNDEDTSFESVYESMKQTFELNQFRVLNPPGYMTRIDDSWIHYTRQQLIDMNSGLFLDTDRKERFIDWWLRDHTIRTYSKIGYFVDSCECPPSVFNTFTSFAAETLLASYDPTDCKVILNHIRLLCNHNEEAYEFLLDWFAVLLQRPGFLNGICVIFKGKHGCGKDMFLSWFGTRIIGLGNYFKTARPHIDLFGAFNSSRKDIVFYHIEEGNDAVFKDVNLQQFKNCITDPYASIQIKQKNTTTGDSLVKNYNHFAISTNHVISCEINERRFFGVEASSEQCKSYEYFTTLASVMDNPNIIASFYMMLKNRDIRQRNWCDLPQTEYMNEMKAAAIPELYYFLEEFIEVQQDGELIEIKASELYQAYRDWHSLHGTEKLKTNTAFGKEIKLIKGINKKIDREGTSYTIEKCKFSI